METWYRTGRLDGRIETVQVVDRTPQFITVRSTGFDGETRDRREKIRTSYSNYWPTLEEATGYLLDRGEKDVKRAENDLSAAKSRLVTLRKRIADNSILKT